MTIFNSCLNPEMDIYETRRLNLEALIKVRFGDNQAKAGAAMGVKQPQMNRWLSTTTTSPRKISETSARQIEEKLGLVEYSLDSRQGPLQDFQWILANGRDNEKSILLATIDAIMSAHQEVRMETIIETGQRKKA